MAKKALLERNKRRLELSERFKGTRDHLKMMIKQAPSFTEKIQLIQKLDNMKVDSSKVRFGKRCFLTGRKRGLISQVGIARSEFRKMIYLIPGIRKASW